MSSIESRSGSVGRGPVTDHPRHLGLDALFRQQAEQRPEAIAAIYGAQELSYGELDRRASRLAAQLTQRGMRREAPVGILLEPGLDQIVGQVAVIRAGGSCLPLDPSAPDARLKFMLDDLQTGTVLTTVAWQPRVAPRECVLIEDSESWPPETAWEKDSGPDKVGTEHRSHILFTSGTTGRPKAVEVLAHGVIRLTVNPHYVTLGPDDRLAAIANPSFDAALFEIWGALLNGGTVVLLPKQTYIDPRALRHSLRVQRITTMFITTTLFNQTVHACPDAFGRLRQLLVGGEALNPRTLRRVLETAPPLRLMNVYGPTEGTTFSLYHEIALKDVEGESVPIGRPIDNTQVFVLDGERRIVPTGETGEIHIGGDGLARGYWNRPELNAERFIEVAGLVDGQAPRLYKTGDLGSWREDGALRFHGRNDNQVKIRGHRIEIEEIEAVLIASDLLREAAVTVQETEFGDKYLMAVVVPHDARTAQEALRSREPDASAAREPADIKGQLIRHLESRLPVYMRPRLALANALPMNANGKVDRRALLQRHDDEQATQDAPDGVDDPRREAQSSNETEAILRSIWQRTLDIETAHADDDFFALGGDSLQAAGLVIQVARRFNYPLPVHVLYDNPTPSKLARYLELRAQSNGGFDIVDDIAELLADARLPDDIESLAGALVSWRSVGLGRVFITGVTGFLGAFVLRDLLRMTEVSQVACLVRAATDDEGLARIRDNMMQYGVWDETFATRLRPLAGDLAEPDFGLGQARFEQWSRLSDVVFHLGAHVNYIQPYSAHRAANVTGTLNVLRFTTQGNPKPLHYVSTIAAFGPAGLLEPTAVVYEDDDMAHYLTGLKFDSGYSQSQWVVEQLVWEAVRRGVPASVYRPGFIMGDSGTGAGNPNDFVARLVKGCIALGAYPALPRQGKEFVPVDYVSAALLRIASDDRNLARAYHLVPPHAHAAIDLLGFFDLLGTCGFPLDGLPYAEWVRRLADSPGLETNPLMPLVPMLAEPVYGQMTRWEVYEGMPVYDTSNTARSLEASGALAFPHLDVALLRRYLDYWTRIGFLGAIEKEAGESRAGVTGEAQAATPGSRRGMLESSRWSVTERES